MKQNISCWFARFSTCLQSKCYGKAEPGVWKHRQYFRTTVKRHSRAKSTRIEEKVKKRWECMPCWGHRVRIGQAREHQPADGPPREPLLDAKGSRWWPWKAQNWTTGEINEGNNKKKKNNQLINTTNGEKVKEKWSWKKSKRRSTNRKSPLFWVYDVYSKKKEKKHTANPN